MAVRTINQIQEKAQFYQQPQFTVNQSLMYIDLITKKECSLITSASLPSNFTYFIPNYTSQKPLLCLDLDETLIASSFKQGGDEDFQIHVTYQNIDNTYSVLKRQYLDEFLLSLAEDFELAIFTYSIKQYADKIIKIIDTHNLIKYKFYREHCVRNKINESQFVIIKDLTRVGVPLDRILLIDNTKRVGEWQPNNFIWCESFYGDRSDEHLRTMLPRIKALGKVPSIYKELEKENEQ
ncbi:Nuclear_LIM interactor-interacting factor [Hexamita inflata]|uniref:Mitochondrial import inner membrane translocase subunit TIM50 n=1 Tax=Hexamita inflata TaxID=28002 RepID=A0ABP1I9J2_9EUKA